MRLIKSSPTPKRMRLWDLFRATLKNIKSLNGNNPDFLCAMVKVRVQKTLCHQNMLKLSRKTNKMHLGTNEKNGMFVSRVGDSCRIINTGNNIKYILVDKNTKFFVTHAGEVSFLMNDVLISFLEIEK